MTQALYVNPNQGSDRHPGTAAQPFKTLTAALGQSRPGTTLHLAAGLYTAAMGEQFPVVIGPQRRVVGAGGSDRPGAILQGGGAFTAGDVGGISLTCSLEDQAQLEQVTVINTHSNGVGIWLGTGRPLVQGVHVRDCGRYGIAIGQEALPTLVGGQISSNQVCGVAWFRRGKGTLIRVHCHSNALAVGCYHQSAPLIQSCDIRDNRRGLLVGDQARPVLRGNEVHRNQEEGLVVQGQGEPDLGSPWEEGGNSLRHNGRWDIQNTGPTLTLCGNDVVPQGLTGAVNLVALALPDPAAAPPSGQGGGPPATDPTPAPAPPAGSQRFTDLTHHWAGAFVDGLADQGLVQGFGDGSFRPGGTVTRAQFAALVVVSFPDVADRHSPVAFRDVPRSFWGATAITQAQRRGFLRGYPDGTFRPDGGLARIEAIVALAQGLQLPSAGVEAIGIYRDRAQVPSYGVDALAAATQGRVVVNAPDPLRLRPMEPMTRGEVAALIYQGRVAQGLAPAIPSPYIVEPDNTQPLFADADNHWAQDFIRELAIADLVSGMKDGRFLPDEPMNRAQYAALVVRAFQPRPQRPAALFRDVTPDFWAAAAIQSAYRGGFVSGFPDNTYGPSHPLLRVQVWVSLVEGAGLGRDTSPELNPLGQFTDYTQIPRYALPGMAIALAHGIIVNHPTVTVLRTNQVATRGEVCAAVYQTLAALGRVPRISSPYIAPQTATTRSGR